MYLKGINGFEELKKNAWVQANILKDNNIERFEGIKMIPKGFLQTHPGINIPLYSDIVEIYFDFLNDSISYEKGVEKIKLCEDNYLKDSGEKTSFNKNTDDEDDFCDDSFKFLTKINIELKKNNFKEGEYTFECPICNSMAKVKKFHGGIMGECSKCGISIIS